MGLQLEGLIMPLPPPPPPPRRLLLDQTEKKILDTAPSPSFLTGPDNRPPPPGSGTAGMRGRFSN